MGRPRIDQDDPQPGTRYARYHRRRRMDPAKRAKDNERARRHYWEKVMGRPMPERKGAKIEPLL